MRKAERGEAGRRAAVSLLQVVEKVLDGLGRAAQHRLGPQGRVFGQGGDFGPKVDFGDGVVGHDVGPRHAAQLKRHGGNHAGAVFPRRAVEGHAAARKPFEDGLKHLDKAAPIAVEHGAVEDAQAVQKGVVQRHAHARGELVGIPQQRDVDVAHAGYV